MASTHPIERLYVWTVVRAIKSMRASYRRVPVVPAEMSNRHHDERFSTAENVVHITFNQLMPMDFSLPDLNCVKKIEPENVSGRHKMYLNSINSI